MSIKFYNTLSRRMEEFVPLQEGKVKFYVCGPTVYDYIHLGNARAFIVFDVLRRFLRFVGYDVTYVMNLTDVDDKIIRRSQQEGVPIADITKKFTDAFFEDLGNLGILGADFHPPATENMPEIVDLIRRLMENGAAYEVEGDVYFEVSQFKEYGLLSGKKTDELRSGARVTVDKRKKNPLDFALWKSQKPGEPAWESPWGPGRPGWHVECSAMSMKFLGETFDIHAGGTDLIFPHHENEIAQSVCATGGGFVRYWLHNGFLNIAGEKMSKSLGNFKTVRDVLKHHSQYVIRMFFLQKHYRTPIDLTPEGLHAATSAVSRLKIFHDKLIEKVASISLDSEEEQKTSPKRDLPEPFAQLKAEIIAAMSDDLNTPTALAKLFDIVREGNKYLAKPVLSNAEQNLLFMLKDTVDELNSFLGLLGADDPEQDSRLVDDLVGLLIEVRSELRLKKEWELADKIRHRLDESGVALEDSGTGTHWRKKDFSKKP